MKTPHKLNRKPPRSVAALFEITPDEHESGHRLDVSAHLMEDGTYQIRRGQGVSKGLTAAGAITELGNLLVYYVQEENNRWN